MRSRKDLKIYIKLTLIFLPILAISSECILFLFNLIVGTNYLPRDKYNIAKYDPITGTRGYLRKEYNYKKAKVILDRHDLVKTPYVSNSKNNKNSKGILFIGSSVAMGFRVKSKENKNIISGVLETEIRKARKDIDIVNLSFYPFSSWMVHAELMRYLNSNIKKLNETQLLNIPSLNENTMNSKRRS